MKKPLLSLLLFIPLLGFGQVSISAFNKPYNQNFNSLPNSGIGTTNAWAQNSTLGGWHATKDNGTVVAAVSQIDAGDGSSTTFGRINSFGTGTDTDRALGSVANTTQGTFYYGIRVKNTTGEPVKSITVSYTGEQWRDGGKIAKQSLTFDYAQVAIFKNLTIGTFTSTPQLSFTSPVATGTAGALDGNLAANRVVITYSFDVDIPNNEEIILRWTDINDNGKNHGLGIDDFSVTFFNTIQPKAK